MTRLVPSQAAISRLADLEAVVASFERTFQSLRAISCPGSYRLGG